MEGDVTPITADMVEETPVIEQINPEQDGQLDASVNGHSTPSPTVAEAIAERELKAILEAMLFVSPEPLPLTRLIAVLGDVTKAEIEQVLRVLSEELEREGRGVRLAEIAGGYRLVTKQEYAPWVKRLDKARSTAKLSRSALESLAIIAYKQPIVRSEIEEIRGVETSGVVRTLLERKLVRIVGRKEVPGRPIMYGTTKFFLEHFGLNDLSQLPPLREFKELGESEQSLLPMDPMDPLNDAAPLRSDDAVVEPAVESDSVEAGVEATEGDGFLVEAAAIETQDIEAQDDINDEVKVEEGFFGEPVEQS
jgi:segregation and condensation protein B